MTTIASCCSLCHLSTDGKYLVADLGADKTWRLRKSSEGKWESVGSIDYLGLEGGGPRHIGVYGASCILLPLIRF